MVAYTVLAIAAGSRALVQLAQSWPTVPTPYALSLVAAAVYLVLAVALRRPGRRARLVATAAAAAELVGVLAVGGWEHAHAGAWPDQTVWSGFGAGYGWSPLVLPVIALTVLTRLRSPGSRPRTARLRRRTGISSDGHRAEDA